MERDLELNFENVWISPLQLSIRQRVTRFLSDFSSAKIRLLRWREFREATGLTETRYDVAAFGDNPAMAADLAELVVARTKRATAGLVQQFGHGKEPPPIVGGHFIVVDGNHQFKRRISGLGH
jgi:hypothetical protein